MYSTEDNEGDAHSKLKPIEAEMFLSLLELEAAELEEPEMAYMVSQAGRWTYSLQNP